jgi:hypothetical protein
MTSIGPKLELITFRDLRVQDEVLWALSRNGTRDISAQRSNNHRRAMLTCGR